MIFSCLYYQNEYYIGTYGGGMYVFNPVTLTLRDFAPDGGMPFSKGHIFCIKQDNESNLWIGTSLGIFCYKNGRQIAHYTSANSKLPEGNVYEIYFDSTHKGWICTENGMCIWDPSVRTLKTDVFPEGFIHKEKVRVIYEDSDHDLYFFPDKGSLFISDLSMTTFRRLQPGTPLDGNDGMFVVEDREKWLWLGTNNGLFRYDKKDCFIPYNFVDGIPSSIFTLCPPVRDENGIWFGNSKGLLYLDAVRMNQKKSIPYPVAITEVCVNGKSVVQSVVRDGGKSEISLESSQKNVTFYFSDFSYTAPAFMSYEYQLEGEDAGWIAVTGRSDMTYYDLPSGTYTFKVRRTGNPESETQMTVKIASSISIWSIVFIVIAVVTGGIAVLLSKKKEGEDEREEPMPGPAKVIEKEIQSVKETNVVAEEKYKTNKISVEECKRLADKLEIVMHKEKPYTNPNLKIADLAASIGTSSHTLSYLFNQYLNRNYYDYINDYRIAEFKRLVEKDEYAKYTLSALAELCGFSSRASFFRYFKKATNITPNEYIRSIGKNNE
jgi:AraC-like DNA-binding protein